MPEAPNSQAPGSKEIPSSNIQVHPEGDWSLMIENSLGFGLWDL
jgi:hypothetical protein